MQQMCTLLLKKCLFELQGRRTWQVAAAGLVWMMVSTLYAQKPATLSNSVPASLARAADKFSRFRQYTMEQGLSHNSITCIAQDEDGFMWFGTEEGLNRFDGEHFTSFYYRPDRKGLPFDEVIVLKALPRHRLLIGTIKGLCVLDTRYLEFTPIALPHGKTHQEKDEAIWALHLDRQGKIWVGTTEGVHLLNDQLRVVQSFFKTVLPGHRVDERFASEFLEFPDGVVAIKVLQSSPNGQSWQVVDFQKQKAVPLAVLYPEYRVLDTAFVNHSVVSDGKTSLWYTATGQGSLPRLYHLDLKTHKSRLVLNGDMPGGAPVTRRFNRPFLLPDSLLLVQQYFGNPIIYDLRTHAATELPQWKTSAPDGKALINFVDRDGNLWLCPRFEGIYFLTLKNLPATPMTALNAVHRQTMNEVGVSEEWFGFTGIEVADRWVAGSGNGGLYSMSKAGSGLSGPILGNPFGSYAYPTRFTFYRGDTVWMTTLNGLEWYSARHNTHGLVKDLIPGLDLLDPRFIYHDRDGLIWSRVRGNGVCYVDTRTRKFHHFPSQGTGAPFPILSATAVTGSPDGDLWFSYGDEETYLVRWRRKTGVFEKIAPRNETGRYCTKAYDLLADGHDNLWLFTAEGTFVMDRNTLQVSTFGKNNGLSTNYPSGYCLDKNGQIWFASPYGLSRYDFKSRNLRTFYQSDGLLSNTVTNVELLDTARNILLVSTGKGLCLFEPDKLEAAAPASAAFITGLRISDHATALPKDGFLPLSYTRNDLRIEFTGINFIHGAANRYQYSMELEGRPTNWREAGVDNFASFLNLQPGRYTFRARAANTDGVWGEQEAILNFVIYPPWWQTWTFRISLLAALLAFAWWLYRRQIRVVEGREKEKAQVRQRLADLEMKALRSQMNPHFVFNALNSVQNFILKNDTREASRYLTKFARLMRLILENSEAPMVPLAREIELLRYYTELEALRFNHRFSFDFQIDVAGDPDMVSIPGMLIQPHIENAIWHGLMHKTGEGHLWVRFIKTAENRLTCEIEDNGVGRSKAAEIEKDRSKNHRPTGLANIRHRLELLNTQLADDIRFDIEDLYDASGQPRGTRVTVRMPLSSTLKSAAL